MKTRVARTHRRIRHKIKLLALNQTIKMRLRVVTNFRTTQIAALMAARRKHHRTNFVWHINKRHPHCDRVGRIKRPINMVLMPRCDAATRLFKQSLVVIQTHAVDTHQIGCNFGKSFGHHKLAGHRVDCPQIHGLYKRLAISVALTHWSLIATQQLCRTFYRRQIFANFCTRGKAAHHRVPVAFKTLRKRRVNFNRVVKRDHALHKQMLLTRQNPPPNN